jgi:WD40 repeat protein
MAISSDQQLLVTGGADGLLCVWKCLTGSLTLMVRAHSDRVLGVTFSPDCRLLASAALDKAVAIIELASGEVLNRLFLHQDAVNQIAFTRD